MSPKKFEYNYFSPGVVIYTMFGLFCLLTGGLKILPKQLEKHSLVIGRHDGIENSETTAIKVINHQATLHRRPSWTDLT